jgi:hypothetical protein
MKKKITSIISVILIFCIGLIVGKLLDWSYFKLTKDISIIEAFTLISTIGAALYISKILEKEVQDKRIEKDLHISKISEIESLLIIIEDLIENKDSSYHKINSRIHTCRIIKTSIFNSLQENFKKITSKKIQEFENSITYSINSLKRLLTETPTESGKMEEITLKNGMVTYSTNRISEINIEINSIRENIFKLKVRINNL